MKPHNVNGPPGALLPLALPLGFAGALVPGRAALRGEAAQRAGRHAATGGGADHLAHALPGGAKGGNVVG